jgi:RHS repeat-associated protein
VDPAGRLVSITNAIDQVTGFQYDNLDQILKATDPTGNAVSFAYDPNGNLLSVTDPKNGVTSYTYDSMDRRSTRTDPLQRVESVQRDLFGNVLSRTDRKGQVTAYSYDSLNRVTFAGFNKVVNGGTTYESTIAYSYDRGDRLTQATDSASGAISYTYDSLGRLLTETTPQGTLSYTYDLAGRRTKRSLAGQPDVTYAWDDASRSTQITQGASSVGFTYDNANRRSVLTLPNGVTATYTYDTDSRLTGLSYQLGTTSVGNLSYIYDALGHRTQVSGSLARTNFPNALTSATYDAANELTTWNGTAITYDANGNLTSDGSRAFTWNARNQLIGIGGSASFQYDAIGRRTNKTAGTGATSFLYDGGNAIQENSGAANILTGGIDEFFQRNDASGSMVPLTDALGSVLALADSSGAIQSQYTYDPFGNTSSSGALSANATQYTGRENDGTGLYYYRARYYNPAFQRFISEDPIGLAGGINLYAYAGNSPTGFTDPFGTEKGEPGSGGSGSGGSSGTGSGGSGGNGAPADPGNSPGPNAPGSPNPPPPPACGSGTPGEPSGPSRDFHQIIKVWHGLTGPIDAIIVPTAAAFTGTAIAVTYGAFTFGACATGVGCAPALGGLTVIVPTVGVMYYASYESLSTYTIPYYRDYFRCW